MAYSLIQLLETSLYKMLLKLIFLIIEANLSGPKRPQDLIPLSQMKEEFNKAITAPQGNQGFGLNADEFDKEVTVKFAKW